MGRPTGLGMDIGADTPFMATKQDEVKPPKPFVLGPTRMSWFRVKPGVLAMRCIEGHYEVRGEIKKLAGGKTTWLAIIAIPGMPAMTKSGSEGTYRLAVNAVRHWVVTSLDKTRAELNKK